MCVCFPLLTGLEYPLHFEVSAATSCQQDCAFVVYGLLAAQPVVSAEPASKSCLQHHLSLVGVGNENDVTLP